MGKALIVHQVPVSLSVFECIQSLRGALTSSSSRFRKQVVATGSVVMIHQFEIREINTLFFSHLYTQVLTLVKSTA